MLGEKSRTFRNLLLLVHLLYLEMCNQVVRNKDRGIIASTFVIMNSCGQINSPHIPNYEEGEVKLKQVAEEYAFKCDNVGNIRLPIHNAILDYSAAFHKEQE